MVSNRCLMIHLNVVWSREPVKQHDVNIGVVMMALTAHKSLPLVRLKRAFANHYQYVQTPLMVDSHQTSYVRWPERWWFLKEQDLTRLSWFPLVAICTRLEFISKFDQRLSNWCPLLSWFKFRYQLIGKHKTVVFKCLQINKLPVQAYIVPHTIFIPHPPKLPTK